MNFLPICMSNRRHKSPFTCFFLSILHTYPFYSLISTDTLPCRRLESITKGAKPTQECSYHVQAAVIKEP